MNYADQNKSLFLRLKMEVKIFRIEFINTKRITNFTANKY